MTDNIKHLFQQMNESTKEEAIACLKEDFNVHNRKWVMNEWIKGGRIPEFYQEKIVEVFQMLLRKQAVTIKR